MTPNHIPANKDYPGMIRFTSSCGRTFQAVGDPDQHADLVRVQAERRLKLGIAVTS